MRRRLLRFEHQDYAKVEEKAEESSDLSFKNFTLNQLEYLLKSVETEIEKRIAWAGGKVEIYWEGYWEGGFEKKPYLAIVTAMPLGEVKAYDRRTYSLDFLPLSRDGKRYFYRGFIPRGTILKGRVRIDDTKFYKVEAADPISTEFIAVPYGLTIINTSEAIKEIEKLRNK